MFKICGQSLVKHQVYPRLTEPVHSVIKPEIGACISRVFAKRQVLFLVKLETVAEHGVKPRGGQMI